MSNIDVDLLITNEIQNILGKIQAPDLKLYLVGGVVRDFIFFHKISNDLDFEVHLKGTQKDFEKYFDEFFLQIKEHYLIEKLPYLVYRISHKTMLFTLEFSCPRVEVIKESSTGIYSHHYFDADLNPMYSLKESFKRRDFTVNAIAILLDKNLKKGRIVDPYDGKAAFLKKELRNVSDDFVFDPVRYLRAFRFRDIFGLEFSIELKKILIKMKLNELSLYYFLSEWNKSRDAGFGKRILVEMQKNAPFLPPWSEVLNEVITSSTNAKSVREVLILNALTCTDEAFKNFKQLNFDKYLLSKDINAITILRDRKWFSDYKRRLNNFDERFLKDVLLLNDLRELKRYTDAFCELREELVSAEFVCKEACDWFASYMDTKLTPEDQIQRDKMPPEWRAFFGLLKYKGI